MSHDHAAPSGSQVPVLVGLLLVLALYVGAIVMGWPQAGTEMILAGAHQEHDDAHAHDHPAETHESEPTAPAALPGDETDRAKQHADHHEADHHDAHAKPLPSFFAVIPFVLLLGAIAVLPLLHSTAHWWENNLNRFIVAAALGLVTLAYYAVLYGQPIERHFLSHAVIEPGEGPVSWTVPWTVFQNAIFNEYIPFIVLLFSLYTISGGIRIEGDLPAHPMTNTLFIAVGGLLASFVGTTGAAMLLIRPLLETNSERRRVAHTVVFFIFVVCNCGGCLLPIGDPPLFLGYLAGVDFLWTLNLWQPWLLTNFILLVIYYLWDRVYAYPRETKRDIRTDETQVRGLRFMGLMPNAPLLVGVVLSVALLDPSKAIPGTTWHPWLYLREVVQLGLVAVSLALGSSQVRIQNRFSYAAIVEVAALFSGIFICMQPALQILGVHGGSLGIDTPQKFFWVTGGLSSVLDNAPTYLVFFQTARALDPGNMPTVAGVAEPFLVAISLGAVFMGAMTYIGNGPNFMVKSIAESAGVKMPSFFGYMVYSCCVLLPVFVLVSFLFL